MLFGVWFFSTFKKKNLQDFCLSKLLEACKEAAGWPGKEEEGNDEAVQVKSHLTLPKGTVIKLVSVLEE